MEQFSSGDEQAFDGLFTRHAQPVYRYLHRLVRNDAVAEELTQEVFLSIARAPERYLRGAPFKPWLYAIATNAARDHQRRERTAARHTPTRGEEEVVPPPASDPGLDRAVRAALQELSPDHREALVLHRFEGLSFPEIAQALGISLSAAKVRAHRGYERLRALLGDVWKESE